MILPRTFRRLFAKVLAIPMLPKRSDDIPGVLENCKGFYELKAKPLPVNLSNQPVDWED